MSMVNKNNSGSSLIEILIATVILGFFSMTLASVFDSQARSLAFLEDKYSSLALYDRLKLVVGTADGCQRNFKGILPGTQYVTSIKNVQGLDEIASSGPLSQFDKIKIESIQLRNIDVPNKPNASGRMAIDVNISRLRGGKSAISLKPITHEFLVGTDTSGKISSCASGNQRPSKYNYFMDRSNWNEESAVAGKIGAGRNCFARVTRFNATYRYNGAGCIYNESTGEVLIYGAQTVVYCEVLCYDEEPPISNSTPQKSKSATNLWGGKKGN